MGDFNRDTRDDVVITSPSALFVQISNGDGAFKSSDKITWKSGSLLRVFRADHNHDGKLDLGVQLFFFGNPFNYHNYVALGKGNGKFGQLQFVRSIEGVLWDPSPTRRVFDEDNFADSARISYTQANTFVDVFLFDPISWSDQYFGSYEIPDAIDLVVGDVDRDGNNDIITAGESVISILFGHGDGTFDDAVSFPGAPSPGIVRLGDFDGDGRLDVIVGSYSADTNANAKLFVLFNNGSWSG